MISAPRPAPRKPVSSVTRHDFSSQPSLSFVDASGRLLTTDEVSPEDIAAAELHADHCVCKARKQDGDPFCARHMNKLPAAIRARLRGLSFAAGYVPVYIQARELVLGASQERTA
jgi:hypothetical protein